MSSYNPNFHDPKVIDQRIIRSSRVRLVASGSQFELYQYAVPYHYNFPPMTRAFRGQSESMAKFESNVGRRDSNLNACRQRIRRLVESNVNQYGQLTKFITITFKENETNLSRANKEFGLFIKRLNYDLAIKAKYVSVVEFQKRGAIHYHVVFFNVPYVEKIAPRIQAIWGLGNVDVRAVRHVRSVGAYLVKYLQKEVFDERLAREKAFFCSKGLIQPIELKNPSHVAKFLEQCTIEVIATREYRSTYYGDIVYKSGYLTKNT